MWKKLIGVLVMVLLILTCVGMIVSGSNGASSYVRYKLVDVDDHIFHMTSVSSESLTPGKLHELKYKAATQNAKILGLKAFNATEQTDLKVEKGIVLGFPGYRVYISPQNYRSDIQIDIDYQDSSSFFEANGMLCFFWSTSYEVVDIFLPRGYALVYSNTPVQISEKDGVVMLRIKKGFWEPELINIAIKARIV